MADSSRFSDVRDKALTGLQMIRETLHGPQEDYFEDLGRYWQGPTNPGVVPANGEPERFNPLLSCAGCPSWMEMGIGYEMDLPFSFHCERTNDYKRKRFDYALGTTFVWSDFPADVDPPPAESSFFSVTRWIRYENETDSWWDSGWRVLPGNFVGEVRQWMGAPLPPSWEGA